MEINDKVAKQFKQDFPIFENNKGLIYLDNAATSQRPIQVINAVKDFSKINNANIHRGLYTLSEKSTQLYEETRKTVAEFINSDEKEIVFTKNTTESLNLLAHSISSLISEGKDEIVLTEMEHHSNMVPWQELAKRNNMKLKFIKVKDDFTLDYEDAANKITNKTAIVSVVHASNILGTINDIEKIINLTKKVGAISIIDAAQSVSHIKLDVKKLDCDFLAFSSHKMLGPTGIGILYGKKEFLNKLPPFNFGGGMIKKVTFENTEFAEVPEKFEAGTQPITEAIGLAEAIKYLQNIGLENIAKYEKELLIYALDKIKEIEKVKVYNPGPNNAVSIISFSIEGIPPHDISTLMNKENIAIRAGHNCAMPLMDKLKLPTGVARASFSFYNTKEDVDKFVETLKGIKKIFE
jgi:cysteine desulfurase / selenocysteine lyase